MFTYLRRWTSGVVSRVDGIVMQIENQEALVDCAIGELKSKIAKAKVQQSRVERDNERLRERVEQERAQAATWRERAKKESDQCRALECLKRSKQFAAHAAQLQQRLSEQERSAERLQADIGTIVTRLEGLLEQRNTMRTRQTRAEAMLLLRGETGHGALEVGEILERWEMRILESEITAGCSETAEDRFEQSYANVEELQDLRQELALLREEVES